ncbi:MAG TPA: UxaA family hydrolase [Vicinamibacterales bacterium]|nr:UxaA family hydrolase [Vicinamibacterales bacterium]
MSHQFLVHAPHDSVGVAITDIHAGEKVEGIVLEDNSVVKVPAVQDVPLGHKIAVLPLAAGDKVIKYSVPIGVARVSIKPGEHVHVHNVKSGRW